MGYPTNDCDLKVFAVLYVYIYYIPRKDTGENCYEYEKYGSSWKNNLSLENTIKCNSKRECALYSD